MRFDCWFLSDKINVPIDITSKTPRHKLNTFSPIKGFNAFKIKKNRIDNNDTFFDKLILFILFNCKG